MKIVFTEQSLESLQSIIEFLKPNLSESQIDDIINRLFEETNLLVKHPYIGQTEAFLTSLKLNHRRLIVDNYKIIYRIEEDEIIYITDFFDSRQSPKRMKG